MSNRFSKAEAGVCSLVSCSDSSWHQRIHWGIALICVAHFFSHFYMLLLPPLLPVISSAMQISYTELGFGITMFSVMTGVAQAPMGVLVDRLGAGWVLITGLALESLAFALVGVWPVYGAFVFLMGVAGLGNSVYHPADYAILNAVALPEKMGRAFSYHTAAGHLGEAVAPLTVLLLASFYGWQQALMICGLLGVVVAGTLFARRTLFNVGTPLPELATDTVLQQTGLVTDVSRQNEPSRPHTRSIENRAQSALARRHLLTSRPILMSVVFFIGLTLISRGVTGFGVTVLHEQHGFSLTLAATLISAWLFASPLGVLVGGRLADGKGKFQNIIITCLIFIAAGIATLAWLSPDVWLSGTLFALCGFASGAIAPSRDMLVRSLTPSGQAGTVFGFVSTGFNVGGIIAPPMFGYLLDRGSANGVFWVVALACVLTVLTVVGSSGNPVSAAEHTTAR